MSSGNLKMIEKEFIQQWEEKDQRKKREFLDEMIYEKEILERCTFFHLDLDEDLDQLGNGTIISIDNNKMKGKNLMSKGVDLSNYMR